GRRRRRCCAHPKAPPPIPAAGTRTGRRTWHSTTNIAVRATSTKSVWRRSRPKSNTSRRWWRTSRRSNFPGWDERMSNREHESDRDRVIADSGWGIKPDDQPANAAEARAEHARTHYAYRPDEPDVIRKILRAQRKGFNTAN